MQPLILVTGASGQLGFELMRSLSTLGRVVAPPRQDFDLNRPERMLAWLDRVNPDIIVNAAAYTQVDLAEKEPEVAKCINQQAPECMAKWAGEHQKIMIHFSTDYVFDGSKASAWRETDVPMPINQYGATKLAGELAVLAHAPKSIVFRVSWLYGATGNNFLRTILKLALDRSNLKIVSDQIGAPTTTYLVSDVTAQALRQILMSPEKDWWGVYHLSAAGHTSWHGFARQVLKELSLSGLQLACLPEHVEAILSSQWPTPAKRPLNSCLNCQKVKEVFGVNLASWEEGLAYSVGQLVRSGALRRAK